MKSPSPSCRLPSALRDVQLPGTSSEMPTLHKKYTYDGSFSSGFSVLQVRGQSPVPGSELIRTVTVFVVLVCLVFLTQWKHC